MPSVMLSRADITLLIPHQGAMCLLDGVQGWDQTNITCTASSHRTPNHPLRDGHTLRALCGIEYAAQTIAVHRGLLAAEDGRRRIGVIGGLRNVVMGIDRLDDIPEDLSIRATKLFEQGDSLIYTFDITAGDRTLLSGRASVMTLAAIAGTRPTG